MNITLVKLIFKISFQATLGVFLYLTEVKYDLTGMSWIPITSLAVFQTGFGLGLGPIPWTVMGEMFSSAVKPKATAICTFFMWATTFATTKLFADIKRLLGSYTNFWMFSFFGFLGIVFIVTLLPETKGKTFMEIQEKIERKMKPKKDSRNSAI